MQMLISCRRNTNQLMDRGMMSLHVSLSMKSCHVWSCKSATSHVVTWHELRDIVLSWFNGNFTCIHMFLNHTWQTVSPTSWHRGFLFHNPYHLHNAIIEHLAIIQQLFQIQSTWHCSKFTFSSSFSFLSASITLSMKDNHHLKGFFLCISISNFLLK